MKSIIVAGNSIDFHAERTVESHARLAADGSAAGHATVTLGNEAPSRGLPAYGSGPYSPEFSNEQNRTRLSVYCAHDCALAGASREGPHAVTPARSFGRPQYSTDVVLDSGAVERRHRGHGPAWSTNGHVA